MPSVLRAQAAALMQTLYVDRFPHIKVAPLTLTRVWTRLHEGVPDEKLKQQDPFGALPKEARPPASMREMKEVLLMQLDRCSNVDLDETERQGGGGARADVLHAEAGGAVPGDGDAGRVPPVRRGAAREGAGRRPDAPAACPA
eukprot:1975617-Rhodomonas_salina.1